MLRPTWERFGIGQFLRHEKDKRLYYGLFRGAGIGTGIRKWLITHFWKRSVEIVEWDLSFFRDLWPHANEVREWVRSQILPSAIDRVPDSMASSVAVHVRLGDFPAHYRTPIAWYKRVIEAVRKCCGDVDIQLFSDGTDQELAPLTAIPGVRRVFYGNALADIMAISRCGFLIGSDSTFSTWGAFLGNVPCVFAHLQDCPPFPDSERCFIWGEKEDPPCPLTKILAEFSSLTNMRGEG